jgi:CheY-like chemotaxis protein
LHKESPSGNAENPLPHDIRVLVIDDDPSYLDLLERKIKKDNSGLFSEVVFIQSGKQLMAVVENEEALYDVILCDYHLKNFFSSKPFYGALDILKLMKEKEEYTTPFFVITDGMTPEQERECFEEGVADIFTKSSEIELNPHVMPSIQKELMRRKREAVFNEYLDLMPIAAIIMKKRWVNL